MPNHRHALRRISWIVAIGTVVMACWLLRSRPASATASADVDKPVAAARLQAPSAPGADRGPERPAGSRPIAGSPASMPAIPGGLSADQWQTLQQRVEPGPQHDREVARIVDLLGFQRLVARLRELRDDPGAADARRALAWQIDAAIPLHLALGEMSGPEALLLKTAVLAETEPDTVRRTQRLDDWRRDWTSAHPPESDPRVADYQRREAAAVAAWQSGPPSQRDPAQLARQLQQLQSAVFDPQP